MGKTRKDAHQQAAENALHSLAGKSSSYSFSETDFFFEADFYFILHKVL
jgi:hypothetical protein